MRVYSTPGVHHEVHDANAGGVAPLRTDVAAFVGLAERGPLHLAVPVESTRQFIAWFGDVFDNGYLAYAARGFFENGGRRLWVVRVASPAASAASVVLADAAGAAWRVEAASAGVWGNRLQVRVAEVRRQRSRARLDATDPLRLLLPQPDGFSRFDLVEVIRGADRARAIIAAVDAEAGALVLAQPLQPALPAGGGLSVRVETLAYDLEVREAGRLVRVVDGLSLVPQHERYGPRLLKQPWWQVDVQHPDQPDARIPDADRALEHLRIARNRLPDAPPPVVIRELRDAPRRATLLPLVAVAGAAPGGLLALRGGADGLAALDVRDFIGEAFDPAAAPDLASAARRGIAALDPVDDVALVAVPDIHIRPDPLPQLLPPACTPDACLPAPPLAPPAPPPAIGDRPPEFGEAAILRVQAALVAHCERRRDRFALLDAPWSSVSQLGLSASGLRAWRSRFDSAFAALHAPWLKVVDPRRGARRSLVRAVPPCGHIAGIMAATDLRLGVHASAANQPLQWLQDVALAFDDERHGVLNDLHVNLVRAVPGRGLRLLGARTLSSDPDWRFVNVRRLMSMVARAIEIAIQWAVFEPNDWRTRMKLQLAIGSFLRSLWVRGALQGAVAEEAFYVRCDETNNPSPSRDLGQLLIDVGLAPVVPMEFIVLRIGRDAGGFAIAEAGAA